MASTITIPLLYFLLLLILVQFTHSAITRERKNHIERKHQPSSSNTYVVHANHLSKPSQFATLENWYASMAATHATRTRNSSAILYTYDTVMHGFAVHLTDDEARRMSNTPGVSGMYKDRTFSTHTTRSPGFIGLNPEFGTWPDTEFGDGVIIGLIDTGIWPESGSFNDSGLGPVRPSWRGECVDAEGFNASLCNNKLVGAKAFNAATASKNSRFLSPRDEDGHGTHVASTAAGSEAGDVSLFDFSRGTASGMAPKARIAMYKACGSASCSEADLVAAIDAAVRDGVDIISMSNGEDSGKAIPFHEDSTAIAMFGAARRGVFVVRSAGNQGPGASTVSVSNVAPWMTTVGASTVDRLFPAQLKLGNRAVLSGLSLYTMKAQGTSLIRLVYSSCAPKDLTPVRVMGKVVVCKRLVGAWEGVHVQNAGGAGIVAVESDERLWDGVMAQAFTLPGLSLSYTAGDVLKAYMASVPYPVASFVFSCETVNGQNRAPLVVAMSSRGPNPVVPEILKPDIVAPGLNILAAWSGAASVLGDNEIDARRAAYNILSGTSMSCPHVAGVAALIKKKHVDWTPAMIRSALMTTAGTLDDSGMGILDNGVLNDVNVTGATPATPLATGAGHVRAQFVLEPGLVYDAGEQDYVDFLCTLNYTVEQVRKFVPDLVRCARTLPGGVAGLNYPSFVVVFDGRTHVRTLTRTVTKVSEQPETYNLSVVAPGGVKMTVTPMTLEFKEQNERRSYAVQFRSRAGGSVKPRWDFGHISWENTKHQVRSPVVFMWTN